MTEKDKPAQSDKIACEICLQEVPVSEASVDEASDYVAHFCGLECHAKWKEQGKKPDESE